ncbi:MAG: leucyl aminopeptidase [Planctomycetes bacterium]|nr:leucyl aminopeptidase [Planctomycetota bacterium]
MKFIAGSPKGETVAKFVFEGDLEGFREEAKANNFSGKERELMVAPTGKPQKRLIVAGLGKKDKFTTEKLRRAAAQVGQRARTLDLSEISLVPPAGDRVEHTQAAVEGLALALYEYKRFKSKPGRPLKLQTVRVDGDAEAVRRGGIYARATCLTRDLVNDPPSVCTPRYLADAARRIAKKGVSIKVFDEKQIKKMGMGGLEGVAIGSTEPARFVHLTYKGPGARRSIAIVGKGITFDSGGLCLKPADGMLNMKDDMSGAGAVIGIFSALAELKPRVTVHGIFAATENMPGGSAYKTRDVLRAMNGKTMEIINTDAEGRLILADALSYASRLKPSEIIDMATLTGACVVALGPDMSAIFTASDKLQKGILAAAKAQGEKVWPLPLENEYMDMIKSDVADMKNSGGRWGGAITAALFLREFVEEGIPWAHLDIAGPALVESDRPYRPAGGTGVMVRTLLRYLEEQ